MSSAAAQWALSAAAVVTGGGTLAIIKFAMTKRPMLAGMDATTDRTAAEAAKLKAEAERARIEAAAQLADGLEHLAQIQIQRNIDLEARIDKLLADAARDHLACEARIKAEIDASRAMSRELATLRRKLDVAKLEIADLQAIVRAQVDPP